MQTIRELLIILHNGFCHTISTNFELNELVFLAMDLKKKDKDNLIKEIRPNGGKM